MGKISQRSPLVSPRRRVLKSSSGVGAKKNRNSSVKLCMPTSPPIQSLVDEDSGFGGDQSLDSESSLLSAPGNSNSGVTSISAVPSLAMVPQTKLLLVSLLQGAGDEKGVGTSHKTPPGNVAVGAFAPSTQLTISNGTSQTGNTHGAVTSSGADKEEWHTPYSVGTLVTGASGFSLQGTSGTEVVSELPSVSTTSPSIFPTGTMPPLGNTGSVKGVFTQAKAGGNRLPIDISGEDAQELPGSLGCKNARHIPPLISFKDVSLLSSIHSIKNKTNSTSTPVVRVEGTPPSGNSSSSSSSRKLLKQSALIHSHPSLSAELPSVSSDGSIELMLVNQPEEQHRARYQTEGSRGAVKDEDGKGHPTIKLVGYSKPTIVQVFVGDDCTKTSPHMFYQVCRVSGKNSTPCKEKRIEGTAVIEALLEPGNNMTMSCDCVGILKERNVDVEHRFKAVVSRGRKKSTKCRLVFRTYVTLPNGVKETLQIVSRSIACTQPPGVPEICRKSLSSCPVSGGKEIFIFGKNFAKDTVVIFQETGAKSLPIWEQIAIPEKETLQPIHLIVTVPKYYDETITKEVTVQMIVSSGSKRSEPHSFTYVPIISKKELQDQEIYEEKSLPKGVSLGALQVNRHYAETRMLPPVLQEGLAATKSSHPSAKSAEHSNKGLAVSAIVPRAIQNSSINRKTTGRILRNSSQVSKTNVVISKNRGPEAAVSASQVSYLPNAKTDVPKMKLKECTDKEPENDQKQENTKGTVSLSSLVELLNLAQQSPGGTIEDLVKLMREVISTPSSAQVSVSDSSSDTALKNKVVVDNVSLSNVVQDKSPKTLPQLSTFVSQESVTSKIIPTVTTNFGIWPLTLFPSISTSQSLTSGPRVARVAPIAPTTVVSSPGLTRAVRVCVTEAPNVTLEPPKKKPCDYVTPMDYELSERSPQLVNELRNTTLPSPVSTQSPILTYNATRQVTAQNIITNQCSPQSINTTASPTTVSQEPSLINTSSQVEAVSPVLSSEVGRTTLNTHQQPIFQNMDSSLLQTLTETPQQVVAQPLNVNTNLSQTSDIVQPLNVPLGQSIQDVTHSLNVSVNHSSQEDSQSMDITMNQSHQEENQPLNVSSIPPVPVVSQVVIKAEPQVINQCTRSQDMSTPLVATSVPGPVFNQPTSRLVVAENHSPVNSSTPSCQTTTLASCSATSSSLVFSDPLLSQSTLPMQIGQNGTVQSSTRNHPSVEHRSRSDVLMTPSSTTTQGSMQNEVTSAINLSETELLKFFDPNCFDNV